MTKWLQSGKINISDLVSSPKNSNTEKTIDQLNELGNAIKEFKKKKTQGILDRILTSNNKNFNGTTVKEFNDIMSEMKNLINMAENLKGQGIDISSVLNIEKMDMSLLNRNYKGKGGR